METDVKRLKALWHAYLISRNDDKHNPLSSFLYQFYEFDRVHNEVPKFGDRQSMCGILVRQLRRDIASCCNQSQSDTDMQPLTEYFEHGRGWLVLFVLWKLDVMQNINRCKSSSFFIPYEEVNANRNFASIIISLLRTVPVTELVPDSVDLRLPEPSFGPACCSDRLDRLLPAPSAFAPQRARRRRRRLPRRAQGKMAAPRARSSDSEGLPEPRQQLSNCKSKIIFDLYLSDETLRELVSDSEKYHPLNFAGQAFDADPASPRVSTPPPPPPPPPPLGMWRVKILMLHLVHRLSVLEHSSELLSDLLPGLMDILHPPPAEIADDVRAYYLQLLRLLGVTSCRLIDLGHVSILLGNKTLEKLWEVGSGSSLAPAALLTALQLLTHAFLNYGAGANGEEHLRLLATWLSNDGAAAFVQECETSADCGVDLLSAFRQLLSATKAARLATHSAEDGAEHLTRRGSRRKTRKRNGPALSAHHSAEFVLPSSDCVVANLVAPLVRLAASPSAAGAVTLCAAEVLLDCGACCCMEAAQLLRPLLRRLPAAQSALQDVLLKITVNTVLREYHGVEPLTAGSCTRRLALSSPCSTCAELQDSEARWLVLPLLQELVLQCPAAAGRVFRHLLVLIDAASEETSLRVLHDLVLPLLLQLRGRLEAAQAAAEDSGPQACIAKLCLHLVPRLPFHIRRADLPQRLRTAAELSRLPELRPHVYGALEAVIVAPPRRATSMQEELARELVQFLIGEANFEDCILASDLQAPARVTRELEANTDIWLVYQRLFSSSPLFQTQFCDKNGFSGAYLLVKDIIGSFREVAWAKSSERCRLFKALLILVFETCRLNRNFYNHFNSEVILLSLARLFDSSLPFDNAEAVQPVLDSLLSACVLKAAEPIREGLSGPLGGKSIQRMIDILEDYGTERLTTEEESSPSGELNFDADDDTATLPEDEPEELAPKMATALAHPDLLSLLICVVTGESMCERAAAGDAGCAGLQKRYIGAAAELLQRCKEPQHSDLLAVVLTRIKDLQGKEVEAELWNVLFSLVRSLVSSGISEKNLETLFFLSKVDSIPSIESLRTFLALASLEDVEPSHFFRFPLMDANNPADFLDRPTENFAAICSPLHQENGLWPAKLTSSFSVALWLKMVCPNSAPRRGHRPRPSPQEVDCSFLHLFSLGHSLTSLQVWADPAASSLLFRLIDGGGVLGEATVVLAMGRNKWFHCCVVVEQSTAQMLRITIYLDGALAREVTIKHAIFAEEKPKVDSLMLELGHVINSWSNGGTSKYVYMGPLNLFSRAITRSEEALFLFSLGPDWIGSAPRYAERSYAAARRFHLQRFVSERLSARSAHLFTRAMTDLRLTAEVLKSLYLSFSALDPERIIYRQSAEPGFSDAISSTLLPSFLRRKSSSAPLSLVHTSLTTHAAEVETETSCGFAVSLQTFGGLKALLFLFGKIVGESNDAQMHAEALHVVLAAITNSPRLQTEFADLDGPQMLLAVLCHRRCRLTAPVFAVLLNSCVSKKICFVPENGLLEVTPDPWCFVTNPELVGSVLLSWKVWEKLDPASMQIQLMKALGSLVAGDNVFQRLNIHRLVSECHLPVLLLEACLQQWQEMGRLPPAAACAHLVELLGEAWGAPPPEEAIEAVLRAALLLQPDELTEVTSHPSLFYQSLTAFSSSPSRASHVSSSASGAFSGGEASSASESPSDDLPRTFLASSPLEVDLESTQISAVETKTMRDFFERCQLDEPDINASDLDGNAPSELPPPPAPALRESEPEPQPTQLVVSAAPEVGKKRASIVRSVGRREAPLPAPSLDPGSSDSVSVLVSGLLGLLRDLVLVQLPDQLVERVLTHTVRAEVLAVLALSPHMAVRAAVLQLFSALLTRASRSQLAQWVGGQYFLLLANQMHQNPTSQTLLDAAQALMTSARPELVDLDVSGRSQLCMMLGLLERSVDRPGLAAPAMTSLCKWLANHHRWPEAVECGFLEVCLNCLHRAVAIEASDGPMMSLLGEAIQLLTEFLFFADNAAFYQLFDDFMRLLALLEKEQSNNRAAQSVAALALSAFSSLSVQLLSRCGYSVPDAPQGVHLVDARRALRRQLAASRAPIVNEESRDRLKAFFNITADFVLFVCRGDTVEQSKAFDQLGHIFFVFLTRVVTKPAGSNNRWEWQMWNIRDTVAFQFLRLFCHFCDPKRSFMRRLSFIQLLVGHDKGKKLLNLSVNGQHGAPAVTFLKASTEDLRSGDFVLNEVEIFYKWLSSLGLSRAEAAPWDRLRVTFQRSFTAANEHTLARWQARLTAWAEPLTDAARAISSEVEFEQKRELKKLMMALRDRRAGENAAKGAWVRLTEDVAHCSGVWFDRLSAAPTWELDPTETASREHKRMVPSYVDNLDKKFFKADSAWMVDVSSDRSPLAFLLCEEEAENADVSLLHRNVATAPLMFPCRLILPTSETPGSFVICEHDMHFLRESEEAGPERSERPTFRVRGPSILTWELADVTKIYRRRYELRNLAIEIFLASGRSYLIAFNSRKRRQELLTYLDTLCRDKLQLRKLTDIRAAWMRGDMSNFDYLMQLNTYAGRSYNDLMQYPVFPFVLADYSSAVLDLLKPDSFRNLAKPVSVQHRMNEQKYRDKFQALENQYRELAPTCPYVEPPYHYSSHYSNSGTVLHYLLRVPSFTTVFIQYQDSHFDHADRTFHSLATSWRLSSLDSESDVKELIPECFFLPEMFENTAGFNFGLRQNGFAVDRVSLPPWADNDARLFCLIHRAALESPQVSVNLSRWIDLIFGFKQAGKRAIEAINIYHPYTYFGAIDPDAIEDPVRRRAVQTMIRTYGQTPMQLLKVTPHSQPPPSADLGFGLFYSRAPASPPSGPLPSVLGLRWGAFVGSPMQPEPVMAWSQNPGYRTASLELLGEDLFALAEGLSFAPPQLSTFYWGGSDRVLLYKALDSLSASAPTTVSDLCSPARVTCGAALWNELRPTHLQLALGFENGQIRVYRCCFSEAEASPQWQGLQRTLCGHRAAVSCLAHSGNFGLLVSGDAAGALCLWDTTSWRLLRLIDFASPPDDSGRGVRVMAATVSDTMGDIAAAFGADNGCHAELRVCSLNGRPIGSRQFQAATRPLSAAYSNLPEGRNMNILAVGCASGLVEILSSWTLALVRRIDVKSFTMTDPYGVTALRFSADAHRVFAACGNAFVYCFENGGEDRAKQAAPAKPLVPVTFL